MKIDWLIGGLVVLGHAAAAQSQNAGEYLSSPPVTPLSLSICRGSCPDASCQKSNTGTCASPVCW